jgi:hypothetical protein
MLYGYGSDTDFEASESGEYRSRFNYALCLPQTLGFHLGLQSRQQSFTPQTPGSPPCQFQLSSLLFQLSFSFLTVCSSESCSTTGLNYFLGPGMNFTVAAASPERRLVKGFGASGFTGFRCSSS